MATARASSSQTARSGQRPAPSRSRGTSSGRPALQVVADRARPARRRLATFKVFVVATAVILIMSFSAVVALHALHVQVQVEIDAARGHNAELETVLIRRLAALTEHDSPAGLLEAALSQGLVPSSDVVMLSPPAHSTLARPASGDPFSFAG